MAENPKYSYNDIPNMQTDWAKDPTNDNKPFSGKSVQKFIKEQIEVAQTKGDYAEHQGDYAKAQGDYAKELNDHPPYIGDGTNGEKNYWYVWVNHEYMKSSYAKGDDIDYSTMTQEEYQRLVDNVKADLVFSSVKICEEIVGELT